MLQRKEKKNGQAEVAESGLEREKSHPARLTSLDLVYIFLCSLGACSQIVSTLPDYPGVYQIQTESTTFLYGSPL